MPVAAAFLIELTFYLFTGIESWRNRLGSCGRKQLACMLAASGTASWLVYAPVSGQADIARFLVLLLIAGTVSFWYAALRPAAIADALFLVLLAAIYLSKVFDWIYVSPIPKQSISVLGKLMLIRTAAIAILLLRGNVKVDFRFLPNRREWITGLLYFAPALAVVGTIYWLMSLVHLRPHPLNALQAVGTFLGVLWAVALPEEFFFRGLLQQWLERWTGHAIAALIAASVIFGSAHLGFHRIFPNWHWAILAGVLGLFLGIVWRNSRSVQASMVTHALIVTVWRIFFV